MVRKDREKLWHKIDWEGFDYCFTDYSSWEDIKDKKFHKLRKAYIKTRNKLAKYIGAE